MTHGDSCRLPSPSRGRLLTPGNPPPASCPGRASGEGACLTAGDTDGWRGAGRVRAGVLGRQLPPSRLAVRVPHVAEAGTAMTQPFCPGGCVHSMLSRDFPGLSAQGAMMLRVLPRWLLCRDGASDHLRTVTPELLSGFIPRCQVHGQIQRSQPLRIEGASQSALFHVEGCLSSQGGRRRSWSDVTLGRGQRFSV